MTAKRRNRTTRASIPYRAEPAVHLTPLFFEADLASAVRASGIKPVAECDLRLVAQGISMGVMDVLSLAYRSAEPSNAERAKYFKKVAAASEHLLQLLDERDNVRTLASGTKIAGGLTGDGGGIRRLMNEVYFLLPEYWLPPGVVIATPLAPDVATPAGLKREEIYSQIQLVPRSVAMLLLVSEHAARFSIKGASAVGRKADINGDGLFTHLAGMFYATFGDRPSTGSDRGDPSQASLLWVERVLRCLWERSSTIRISTLEPSHPTAEEAANRFRALLGKANALAPVTKADYLAAGWHRWRAQPDHLQWPTQFWWPYGCDAPNSAGVPKWLLGKGIMTPG